MSNRTQRLMYAALLLFALAVTLFGPIVAFAGDAGACYNVQDGDARTYCLARAHGDASQCYSIQSAAMRSQCLAEVRK